MRVSISEDNLEFFEALASPVRLKIIGCLSKRSMNIKELAENVGVSSAIMTSHIKKLESAHLVESKKSKQYGKVCSLVGTNYMLLFPTPRLAVTHYDVNLKVGQYTRAEISPTCGIATEHSVIGDYDDPRCFYDPRRENAELIWFSKGYVEYYIPNYVPDDCQVTSIEICAEMCSEYPDVKIDAVSDIDLLVARRTVRYPQALRDQQFWRLSGQGTESRKATVPFPYGKGLLDTALCSKRGLRHSRRPDLIWQ